MRLLALLLACAAGVCRAEVVMLASFEDEVRGVGCDPSFGPKLTVGLFYFEGSHVYEVWVPGEVGTYEVGVPDDFAEWPTDCQDESLYFAIHVAPCGGDGDIGRRESERGMGSPDLGLARLDIIRVEVLDASVTKEQSYARARWEFWGSRDDRCRPNCDHDCSLTINDFICFQAEWRKKSAYGDYNGDGKWNVNDFIAFQAEFRRGCP